MEGFKLQLSVTIILCQTCVSFAVRTILSDIPIQNWPASDDGPPKSDLDLAESKRHPSSSSFFEGLVIDRIFFQLSFLKILVLNGVKMKDPHLATPLSLALVGLFELSLIGSPQGSSTLPCVLLPQLQRYKDTVRPVGLSPVLHEYYQEQLTQTLIRYAFVENTPLRSEVNRHWWCKRKRRPLSV